MNAGTMAASVALGFVATPVLGLVVKGVDRVLTARIQWRKGPPLLQPFFDVLKLLGKETLVSENASTPVFLLAPLLQNIRPVRTLADFIRANEIDAGAYYYTEVEEFAVAEHAIRDTMAHAHSE